jgi:hypothetical protein
MTLNDWLTLAAIVIGPVVAVAITLLIDGHRKARDTQLQVLRMLLSTRHLPADPLYATAINLVPVEFGRRRSVMTAWEAYLEAVRFKSAETDQEAHDRLVMARQTTLIFTIMKALGFRLSETDIQISAYASRAQILRDNMYLDYLAATREIAEALKRQTTLLEGGGLPVPPVDGAQ